MSLEGFWPNLPMQIVPAGPNCLFTPHGHGLWASVFHRFSEVWPQRSSRQALGVLVLALGHYLVARPSYDLGPGFFKLSLNVSAYIYIFFLKPWAGVKRPVPRAVEQPRSMALPPARFPLGAVFFGKEDSFWHLRFLSRWRLLEIILFDYTQGWFVSRNVFRANISDQKCIRSY